MAPTRLARHMRPIGPGLILNLMRVWPSGRLHFLFTAALAPIARNQLAAMHCKGITFDGAPFMVAVAAERLRRLFRLTKGECFRHG